MWAPNGHTVMEGVEPLGGGALWEEVGHWEEGFEVVLQSSCCLVTGKAM